MVYVYGDRGTGGVRLSLRCQGGLLQMKHNWHKSQDVLGSLSCCLCVVQTIPEESMTYLQSLPKIKVPYTNHERETQGHCFANCVCAV
jgi:hypothetical protein